MEPRVELHAAPSISSYAQHWEIEGIISMDPVPDKPIFKTHYTNVIFDTASRIAMSLSKRQLKRVMYAFGQILRDMNFVKPNGTRYAKFDCSNVNLQDFDFPHKFLITFRTPTTFLTIKITKIDFIQQIDGICYINGINTHKQPRNMVLLGNPITRKFAIGYNYDTSLVQVGIMAHDIVQKEYRGCCNIMRKQMLKETKKKKLNERKFKLKAKKLAKGKKEKMKKERKSI